MEPSQLLELPDAVEGYRGRAYLGLRRGHRCLSLLDHLVEVGHDFNS